MFIITADNTIASGVNCIIQVLRMAQAELSIMLEAHNMKFPKTVAYQFDNGKENKVFKIINYFLN